MNKFISNYLLYTKNTETPELVHLWCALSCLAGAAERRVWLDRGMFNIYGNLYVILVGPPGVIAKSSSIGYMLKTLRRCNYEVTEAISTRQKIVDDMANGIQIHRLDDESCFPHTSITFALSELNALLAAGTDMILFLTRIWDEYDSFIEKTIARGTKEIINPYFNMIGAATTEWFSKAVCNEMLSTGFLARSIIVYGAKKRGRHPKTLLGPIEKEAQSKCIEVLNWMKSTFGEIKLTDEAEQFYDDWYMGLTDEYADDPKISGYYERKAKTFSLKVAMLLALGDCRLTVQLEDLDNALKIFDYTEPAMRSCYAMAGANRLAPFARQILKLAVKKKGTLSYQEMLKKFYYDLEEDDLMKVIGILTGMGFVRLRGGCLTITDIDAAKKFLAK